MAVVWVLWVSWRSGDVKVVQMRVSSDDDMEAR